MRKTTTSPLDSTVSTPPPPAPAEAKTELFGTVLLGSSSVLFRPKSVILDDWWLRKVEGESGGPKLGICGVNTMGKQVKRVFRSAPIVKRYNAFTVETVDGVVVTIQDVINKVQMLENDFSLKVCKAFMTGFPCNWDSYVQAFANETSSERISSSDSNIPDQYDIPDCNLDSLCPPTLDCYSSDHISGVLKSLGEFFSCDISTGDVNEWSGISADPISTEINQMPLNENIVNDLSIVYEDCNKDGEEETFNETVFSGPRTQSMHKKLENKVKDKEEMLSSSVKVDQNTVFCKTPPNSAIDLKLKCGWKHHLHGDGSGADEAYHKTPDTNGSFNCSADKVTYSENPLKAIGPSLITAAGNLIEANQSEIQIKAQRPKHSLGNKKRKIIRSSYSYVHEHSFTRKKATDLLLASPEALNLKRSRSGRVLVPALTDEISQKILYNANGSIDAITGLDKLKSSSPYNNLDLLKRKTKFI